MSDTTWAYPNGTKVTFHGDGSITVTDPDGSSEHWDRNTGKKSRTKKDGTVLSPTDPQGPGKQTADGGVKFKYSNGEKIEFGPPPQGKVIYYPPSGTWREIEYDPKTGRISYRPKSDSDKPKEEKPNMKDGKPIAPESGTGRKK